MPASFKELGGGLRDLGKGLLAFGLRGPELR